AHRASPPLCIAVGRYKSMAWRANPLTLPSPPKRGRGKSSTLSTMLALVILAALSLAVPAWGATDMLTVPVTEPQPATLGADSSPPAGGGPPPAVILLHGCGGVSPNMAAWAVWLRSQGYAALVLDSFGGRGLRYLCGDPRPLTGVMRAPDVFAAIATLKTGNIDPNRVAAMGFSHGGRT